MYGNQDYGPAFSCRGLLEYILAGSNQAEMSLVSFFVIAVREGSYHLHGEGVGGKLLQLQ